MQKSKFESVRAWRTGSEIGGFRSEKRVEVNALLGNSESMVAAFSVFVEVCGVVFVGCSFRAVFYFTGYPSY